MQPPKSANYSMAAVFAVAVLIAITAVCAVFLLFDAVIPNWFVIVARWIPALVAAAVLLAFRKRGLSTWFRLRTSWRTALVGSLVAVCALLIAYAIAAGSVMLGGIGEPQPSGFYLQAILLIVPYALIFSLSTLGEEAAWRGFLHSCLSSLGFWGFASAISCLWVIWHIPLHATMVAQGTLPADAAITSTLTLFPLGLFLSAVSHRYGSAWPAVVAHAIPLTALNLIAFPTGPSPVDYWVIAGASCVTLLVATLVLAPRAAAE
ncbi:CPBP family intramembrane glutamic endopeptidase [Corynebacterium sanguinis]|uniref:CPBP family intramembrane glutamic endopeptidase n=1 Tax=Corynebacterium sanguinis TaxID=2594913 RepID=UPI00223AED6B|nr:CPBP family intramembrane glutamic endopeptidase [Corynebacterium sanguinis]MCT1664211.1 CPBP family intramembrane metalloprotease [Corynebacterium sanguinis]MDN8576960.1 CPBP family intramembrane metalloprotease [Corynebacterium sanguinis]